MFKIIEYLIEFFGWLKIVASPFLIGILIGGIVYYNFENRFGLIIGILLSLLGLIVGIIWATRIWKKQGTTQFLSRVIATPELDKKEDKTDGNSVV